MSPQGACRIVRVVSRIAKIDGPFEVKAVVRHHQCITDINLPPELSRGQGAAAGPDELTRVDKC